MSITLFFITSKFWIEICCSYKFAQIFGLICFQIFTGKYIDTISILLGKKLRCVKVLSIAEAVKAKQYSPNISKIWLIRCDIYSTVY